MSHSGIPAMPSFAKKRAHMRSMMDLIKEHTATYKDMQRCRR